MVREWLSEPGHAPVTDLPREEYRARVTDWAEELAMSGGTAMGYPAEFGGLGDVRGSIAGFETLAFGDLSLLVKCGVQFGLFGGAVLHLGTMRHHERHLTAIARFELPGCFAMSESDHGSNVQALQTTATYDAATEEFVVHTPTPGARKDYIGNAARDGRLAVVFAQLVSGGEPRGVHALLVPLRDAGGELLPGVSIEDCGPKLGLDGVDNGRIAFDQVRVGRDALLDRYATVQRRRHVREPDREPGQALLRDARDADPGPRQRLRRVDHREQVRARHRDPPRAGAAPVRPARPRGGAAARLPHAPAPAPPGARDDVRAALRAGAARRPPARGVLRRGPGAPPARARDARGRAQGGRLVARDGDDPDVPRGVRRRRATCRRAGSRR